MKWFYDMKIATKLLAGFITISIIAGIVGIVGYYGMSQIRDAQMRISTNSLPSVQSLQIINEGRMAVMTGERGLTNDRMMDAEVRKAQYAYIDEAFRRIEDAWSEYVAIPHKDLDEQKQWGQFESKWELWKKDHEQVVSLSKQTDNIITSGLPLDDPRVLEAGQQAFDASLVARQSFLEAEKVLKDIIQLNLQQAEQANGDASRASASAITLLIVVIAIGVLAAVVFGVFISRIISKPIGKLVEAANKLAAGDLDVHIEARSKDEVGILAKAFDNMAENISDVMGGINSAAEQVASGARQVSASSQALSHGSTEQASSIEEITASMEEVAAQTKQNAHSANEANELSGSAKQNAVQGNEQMKEMLKAMEEINDSSANISKIIKVIDEIAFQTNILALNAAVEAARAGQHGKGFAVVAEEVRNLAARSANAAKETTTMIEGSIRKVEAGTKIANETAQALDKIVEGVAKATALVGDIASASNEQATGIAQVNQAITQVSQVTQTNSATSEESAAASEELSGQAELLKEMVNKFNLRKNGASFENMKHQQRNNTKVKASKQEIQVHDPMKRSDREYEQEPTVKSKVNIALDDQEFGKY